MNRKNLKAKARQTVKNHWVFLVFAAAMASLVYILPLQTDPGDKIIESMKSGALPVYAASEIGGGIMKFAAALLIGIFFVQILEVAASRLFLEARTYEKVPVQHIFYIASVKKWIHTALAYFKKNFCLFLWSLTVIGGIIKYYSYFLVSFILAENPSLSGKEAIDLSRKMMNGHKWEAFKLQLSMLPWILLSGVTFGIAGFLYVQPYTMAVYSEYYAYLREQEGSEQLNDTYLFAKADDELLQKSYKDLRLDQRYVRMNEVQLNGMQNFFVKACGLFIGSARKRRLYQGTEDIRAQLEMSRDALDKKQYPFRLSPLYERRNAHYEGQLNTVRAYSFWSLIFYFVLSAFCGWALNAAGFINLPDSQVSGLKGPWLLAAGLAGICSLVLTGMLRKKPAGSFIVSIVISAVIVWLFYLNGQTADGITIVNAMILVYLLAMLSMLLIYLIAPYIDSFVTMSKHVIVFDLMTVIVFALFLIDAVL